MVGPQIKLFNCMVRINYLELNGRIKKIANNIKVLKTKTNILDHRKVSSGSYVGKRVKTLCKKVEFTLEE